MHPVVGDGVVDLEHLEGGDGHALADGDGGDRRPRPLPGIEQETGRLARKVEGGRAAQAERPQVPVDAQLPELLADLDGAHVRGVGDDVGDRPRARRVGLVVVDLRRADGDVVGDGDLGGRVDDPLLEGAGDGHRLVGRARFVDLGDRLVGGRRARRPAVGAGREAGHGQDVARLRVGHDGDPALGLGGHDLLGQGPLGLVLHRAVDREDQVAPAHGRLHLVKAGRDLPSAGIVLDLGLPRAPRQLLLVLDLETRQTLVVDADLAQDRSGQVAGGVEALGLLDQTHAVELEGGDPVGGGVVDLARQVDEAAAAPKLVA